MGWQSAARRLPPARQIVRPLDKRPDQVMRPMSSVPWCRLDAGHNNSEGGHDADRNRDLCASSRSGHRRLTRANRPPSWSDLVLGGDRARR